MPIQSLTDCQTVFSFVMKICYGPIHIYKVSKTARHGN